MNVIVDQDQDQRPVTAPGATGEALIAISVVSVDLQAGNEAIVEQGADPDLSKPFSRSICDESFVLEL